MSTIEEIATRAQRTRHYSPSELFAYLLGWLDSLNASLATEAELEQFHTEARRAYCTGVGEQAMPWNPDGAWTTGMFLVWQAEKDREGVA